MKEKRIGGKIFDVQRIRCELRFLKKFFNVFMSPKEAYLFLFIDFINFFIILRVNDFFVILKPIRQFLFLHSDRVQSQKSNFLIIFFIVNIFY